MSKRKNPDESTNPNKDFCEFLMGELSLDLVVLRHKKTCFLLYENKDANQLCCISAFVIPPANVV